MIKGAQICGFIGFYREGIAGGFVLAQSASDAVPRAQAKHAMIASITRFVSSGSRTRIDTTPASWAG